MQILRELLSEFPFANPYDESAAISGLLCAAQRRVLPTAPMYFVTAPDFGTGKSFLCSVMAAIATEKKSTPFTFPSTKEECQKMLLAELRVMPEVIEFDNLVDDLVPHPMLCSALTSQQISDRVLGSSKIISAPTNTFFTGSGTNVRPIKDMMRRTITVELDSKCETPATRKFKRNPLKELLSNRPYYISAILTIIRAWFLAGKPIGSCKPIASYVDWGECCRHPLIWLGLPDPAQSMFRFMARDPDDVLLGQLLEVWHLIFKSKPKMVRDVVKRAQEDSDTDLHTILQEIAGDKFGNIDNKSLGHWIKKKSGKVIKNLRLVQSDTNLHAAQWKVEEIKK